MAIPVTIISEKSRIPSFANVKQDELFFPQTIRCRAVLEHIAAVWQKSSELKTGVSLIQHMPKSKLDTTSILSRSPAVGTYPFEIDAPNEHIQSVD
jgi:hypothetical protein